MVTDVQTYEKIKVLSNKYRFEIMELVSKDSMNISQISSEIGLSYDKTREYVNKLAEVGLVKKESKGRETHVKTLISQIEFK